MSPGKYCWNKNRLPFQFLYKILATRGHGWQLWLYELPLPHSLAAHWELNQTIIPLLFLPSSFPLPFLFHSDYTHLLDRSRQGKNRHFLNHDKEDEIYNHHIRSIFKSHSISVTFKFCTVLGAQGIRATGFKRTQGNTHCTKFESNTNRITFEYAPNMMIVKVHLIVVISNLCTVLCLVCAWTL